jgi:hypothetical protein
MWVDQPYEAIVTEHVQTLQNYGLMDRLSEIHIGLVGDKFKREEAKIFLNKLGVRHTIIVEADNGFEQVTQNALYAFSLYHDGYVLYAHTKGSYRVIEFNTAHRVSMMYFTVVKWKEAIHHLAEVDAVGCHWYTPHFHHHKYPFFAGTFWWSHLSYIRKLGPPDNDDRYDAEMWIGRQPHIRIHDMNTRWDTPNMDCFVTTW